jgi:pimeloyl-ACP methyl ester carboxylesterase
MTKGTLFRSLAVASLAILPGCGFVFPAPTPMRTVASPVDAGHPSKCLVVFLPGFGDDEHSFVDHGFVDALRSRGLSVDAVSAGATYGYYSRRTVLARLEQDVLMPERAKGYQQIWVVGVSMGGLGSLLLAQDRDKHQDLTGVLLLAPYLGDDDLLGEIARAGGVAKWEPGPPRQDDYQRDLWRYLKRVTAAQPEGPPILYLGAGDKDKLGYGHRVLAGALPSDHVYTTPGKHDWGPWSLLWADFLDHSSFRQRCGNGEGG